MKADNEMGVPAIDPKKRPKVRCDSEEIAQKVGTSLLVRATPEKLLLTCDRNGVYVYYDKGVYH